MNARPLTPHFGVEIEKSELEDMLRASAFEPLVELYREHDLILVRRRGLTDEDQIRLTQPFGNLMDHTGANGIIVYVSNVRPGGIFQTGPMSFHHDNMNEQAPFKTGLLYGLQIPASGSITLFRNMSAFCDRLSPALRKRCETVECLHGINYPPNVTRGGEGVRKFAEASAWHPLIRRDPQSGRDVLWIGAPGNIKGFRNIDEAGGKALIEELWGIAHESPDIVYPHDWRAGDLILWNNETIAHGRPPFDASEARTLRRTTAI
jgi:taurine dioxygenase